jgi:hypothetical protein
LGVSSGIRKEIRGHNVPGRQSANAGRELTDGATSGVAVDEFSDSISQVFAQEDRVRCMWGDDPENAFSQWASRAVKRLPPPAGRFQRDVPTWR